MFVRHGLDGRAPIASMPGIDHLSVSAAVDEAGEAAALGIPAVLLFGLPAAKDEAGSGAWDDEGIVQTATRAIKAQHPDLLVITDLCLCEYTSHGHCGVLREDGEVDNDQTLAAYAEMALAQAAAGVDMVGPSGMMDGQVAVVRKALDDAGHSHVSVLAYSAKYASAFFGPFREAVDSSLVGDRRTYQQDAANRRESLREVDLDLDEGADMVMVKPAMSYLDVLREVADMSTVPVAAYQISGEYSMITAAAQNGWIDRDAAVLESLLSIRRAGADIVLTYWAAEFAARL